MFKRFYPYEYIENVFCINYRKLYEKGYRGIIFDIDNTLVPHGMDSVKEVDELFKYIQKIGFQTLLLSNNGEKRIKKFLTNIDSLYISNAEKPKVDGYLKAIEMLNLRKDQIVFVGDQMFTDIYGANKVGLPNILVKYIGYYEKGKKGIRRNLEKIILKLYKRNKSCLNRIGDIQIMEEI